MKRLIFMFAFFAALVFAFVKFVVEPATKDRCWSKYSERYVPATAGLQGLPSRDYRIRSSC